jgi:hypothetical protein
MKGLIFSIKRYAIHDGPGIRVTFIIPKEYRPGRSLWSGLTG